MKPQRISAWRTYSSRCGRFPGMSGGSATGFSNVLKCHQTVVTIFALFATKNSASLFRKFLNLVVLEIKEKKYHTRVWSGPDGWHQAPVVRACHQGWETGPENWAGIILSNIASTSARAPVRRWSRCAVSGLSQASSTNCRAAGASVSGPCALDPMTRRSA